MPRRLLVPTTSAEHLPLGLPVPPRRVRSPGEAEGGDPADRPGLTSVSAAVGGRGVVPAFVLRVVAITNINMLMKISFTSSAIFSAG
jgi:hypothetical protein